MRFRSAPATGTSTGVFSAPASGGRPRRPPRPPLPATLVVGGRPPRRHRPRLRRVRHAQAGRRRLRRCTSTRQAARGLAERLATPASPSAPVEERPYRRSPYAPFMTSHAAAGGRPQAALLQRRGRCRSPSGCTRTATSPTCAPTRSRCRRRRSPPPGSRPRSSTARSTCRTQPRSYSRKVKNAQEAHEAIRPAGDTFRTPGAGRGPAQQRRVPALRADLAAHGRQPDGRRHRHERDDPARARRSSGGEDAVFSASGKVITFPGFLRAYVEGSDDPDAELEDRERRLPPVARGRPARRPRARPARAQHLAAGPLHRGEPGQDAGGARHRPAQHLRQHPVDHPGPRLRVEEGLGARCRPGSRSPSSACSRTTSAGSSTTASPAASRTTSTRSPAATAPAPTG